MKPSRPILRYHGGKWRLAEWIISHMPKHRIYLEAFGGAGSVLMQKPRVFGEIYNDLDGEVVNVFRVIRDEDQASRLAELLRLTPFARAEWRLAYEPSDDPIERARRTICRSQMGFGSDSCNANRGTGFRSNANRRGTNPATDWSRWPDEVRTFVERLRGVVIEQKDALAIFADHDGPATLHYVDPPYMGETRSCPTRGYAVNLDDDGHARLAEVLMGLEGYVIVSGYRTPLYDRLFAAWPRVDREVTVFRQAKKTESLWLSPRTAAALDGRWLPGMEG